MNGRYFTTSVNTPTSKASWPHSSMRVVIPRYSTANVYIFPKMTSILWKPPSNLTVFQKQLDSFSVGQPNNKWSTLGTSSTSLAKLSTPTKRFTTHLGGNLKLLFTSLYRCGILTQYFKQQEKPCRFQQCTYKPFANSTTVRTLTRLPTILTRVHTQSR